MRIHRSKTFIVTLYEGTVFFNKIVSDFYKGYVYEDNYSLTFAGEVVLLRSQLPFVLIETGATLGAIGSARVLRARALEQLLVAAGNAFACKTVALAQASHLNSLDRVEVLKKKRLCIHTYIIYRYVSHSSTYCRVGVIGWNVEFSEESRNTSKSKSNITRTGKILQFRAIAETLLARSTTQKASINLK